MAIHRVFRVLRSSTFCVAPGGGLLGLCPIACSVSARMVELTCFLSGRRRVKKTVPIQHGWTDPDAYETFMGRWSEHLAKPFLSLAGITPGDCVVGVACGTGVLTKALAELGAHVWCQLRPWRCCRPA